MDNNLEIVINQDGFLTEKEFAMLQKKYYELFLRMYGKNLADTIIGLLHIQDKSKLSEFWLKFSENNSRATMALEQLKNMVPKDKLSLLMAYQRHNLVAAARLRNLNAKEASIPDAVFLDESRKKNLWLSMLMYAENHCVALGYERLYVEIPFQDYTMLCGCLDEGYQEDREDAVKNLEAKTILLNKKLARK